MASTTRPRIRLKRAYEAASRSDGTRVLVDRIWPRGVRKEAAALDYWLKELAPSDGLRRWFGHKPARWEEFRKRYKAELRDNRKELNALRDLCRSRVVTLVFGARDEKHNNAVVVKELLETK